MKYFGAGFVAIVASMFVPDPWFVAPYFTGCVLVGTSLIKKWW